MKFFLLFISLASLAQNNPLNIKINSVNYNDSLANRRVYQINYQIENTSNNDVQFFLNPNSLIAQAASSMTLFTVYKMYRNGVYDAMDGPFYEKNFAEQDDVEDMKDFNSPTATALLVKLQEKYKKLKDDYVADYKKNGGLNSDEQWIFKNQKLLQSIVTLQPGQTKNFTIKTSWRRNRYFKIADNEYYLDEKDKFEIQLQLILNKSDRNAELSATEFLKIKSNPNFIEGTFTSNRSEISFN